MNDISADQKVRFLAQASTYAMAEDRVAVVETHMSWVFLCGPYAYKLKKPVRRSFLDFGTIDARGRNCQRELRLNRRLAPDVYLETLPLVVREGALHLGGSGAVCDWLVKMRRLPADRMLDALIRAGRVSAGDLDRFAALMTAFYRDAPPLPLAPAAYLRRIEMDIRYSALELKSARHGIATARVDAVAQAQLRALRELAPQLSARASRLVDGHGDLRPQHVCLLERPVVIDCLEFNDALRLLDPIDEMAYLAVECERLGASDVGAHVLARQPESDAADPALIVFYKGRRALLRAKIAAWHTLDQDVSDHDGWRKRALEYLELARSYRS